MANGDFQTNEKDYVDSVEETTYTSATVEIEYVSSSRRILCVAKMVVCNECPLVLYNVMGQEDLYREDPVGTVVENFLTARIVVTTSTEAEITIDYSANDTSLNLSTGVINPGFPAKYHEVFITGLQPDALYAFRVTAESVECGVGQNGPEESEIYYFTTGNELTVITDEWSFIVSSDILTISVTTAISFNELDALLGDTNELLTDDLAMSLANSVESMDHSHTETVGDTQLYTSFSTGVV